MLSAEVMEPVYPAKLGYLVTEMGMSVNCWHGLSLGQWYAAVERCSEFVRLCKVPEIELVTHKQVKQGERFLTPFLGLKIYCHIWSKPL